MTRLAVTGLAVRSRQDEQMDDPVLDAAVYDRVLTDLARVNRWTLAARPTLSFLRRAVGEAKSVSVLDVGFGQGDMLRTIARWAKRRGIAARLIGVDLNPKSARSARAATPPHLRIDFRTGDHRDVSEPIDIIISSLVAHHMGDDALRGFVRDMEAKASVGWMINDLHRHRLAYRGYPLLARLLRVHPIVREDGTLSIARAFRPADWRAILADAGVPPQTARIVRRFPLRLCVERLR